MYLRPPIIRHLAEETSTRLKWHEGRGRNSYLTFGVTGCVCALVIKEKVIIELFNITGLEPVFPFMRSGF